MHHFFIQPCLLALFMSASGGFAQAVDESSRQPVQESVEQDAENAPGFVRPPHLRDGPSAGGGVKRLRARANGERGGVSRRWRNPSAEDLDRLILVAGELKPEWGTSLQNLRETDQAQFQNAVSNSRRLWHLVELQERNPNLYALRLEEWKNGEQLRALGQGYREAIEAGNSQDAEQLLGQLKERSLAHVDLQIRVRGEELAAMSEALEQLRQEMLRELERRDQLADELIDRLINPREERPGSETRKKSPARNSDVSELQKPEET